MGNDKLIDEQALDGISVAPGDPAQEMSGNPDHPAHHPDQQAGQDESLRRRLKEDPSDPDAKLDVGLDETMDASDPPAITQPGGDEPVPSSGFPG
jgi:hypothetical protein